MMADVRDELAAEGETFELEDSRPLYFMTALLGLLIGADILLGIEAVGEWLGVTNELLGKEWLRLALIAAVIGGARTLYGSLEGAFEGQIGADFALALACIAAIVLGEPLVAAEVVFIGMVGESLEAITFGRTKRELRTLLELRPAMATVLRDGQPVEVPSAELAVGDRILVKPGERVPADGRVVAGQTTIDQSPLTGESIPVDKGAGDEVFTGTLNQNGAIEFEAVRVGTETTFGQVLALIEEAQERKAPLERTADRFARYFLPVVLACAFLTYLATRDAYRTVAVLVVACPCALILATPAAVLAAVARLARQGVVLRGGLALERLARASALVFDKTGTVTQGRPILGHVLPLPGHAEDELLRLAATAEQRSEHVFARAVVDAAKGRGLALEPIDEFVALPGAGVRAAPARGGPSILVGNRRLLEQEGVSVSPELVGHLESLDAQGQTALIVVQGGQPIGAMGVHDALRPDAVSTLDALRGLGFRDVALVTGDRWAVARAVAGQLGIDEVHAEQLPTDKAQFVETWRRQGKRVAMIGDGINDAPALAVSDVGLALGGVGSNIAAEAGDIILMRDPLAPLPFAVRMARQTLRVIQQNIIIFAFLVNGTAILLSAWGVLPPIGAAIYHQVGSLLVLLNSMRLLFHERWDEVWLVRQSRSLDERLTSLWARLDPMALAEWCVQCWPFCWRWKWPLAAGTLAALWGYASLHWVDANEVGVVQRFGQWRETVDPGLYFRPALVNTLRRVRPDEVRTIEIGFRSLPVGNPSSQASLAIEWNSPHREGLVEPKPEEGLVLTGDESVVDLNVAVQYRIADVRRFLFGANDPQAAVRIVAEGVLRSLAAQTSENDLLTTGREAFERQALAGLQSRIGPDGYDLGLDVIEVAVRDVHPPLEVVGAYHEVSSAMEEREQRINVAQAFATTTVLMAQSQAAVQRNQAAGYQVMEVQKAEAEKEAYLARAAAYRLAPQLSASRSFWEAAETSLAGRPKIIFDPRASRNRRIFLGDFPGPAGLPAPFLEGSGAPGTPSGEDH